MAENPFASPSQGNPFASSSSSQPAGASPFSAAPPTLESNPYAQQSADAQTMPPPQPYYNGPVTTSTAVVPSQHQPSNPYAGMVQPPPPQQQQQQQQPFGAAPPQQQYQHHQQPPPPPQHDDFFDIGGTPVAAPAPTPQPQPPQSYENQYGGTTSNESYGGYGGEQQHGSENRESYNGGTNGGDQGGDSPNRNKYSMELARQAPMGASPLPKADLVRKKGFALARISFRTIVMKKWKQTFWVQYGPHTMLWFRTQADFDDWLNNPYHSQQQRNFLIKLAVNFVHDLYKPNVRGYQVTQCRTKGYGNKLVRQFKLERWMDYGPTIAAAFGSYDPKEVDTLREALVECMRNTPLNGGIRATGAVRQNHAQGDNPNGSFDADSQTGQASSYDRSGYNSGYTSGYNGGSHNANNNDASMHSRATVESKAEPEDLLGMDNWDDTPQQPALYGDPTQQQPHPQNNHHPYGQQPQAPGAYQQQAYQQPNPFGQAPPPQQQPSQIGGYPAQPQGQPWSQVNPGAMVPVANAPSPYAGVATAAPPQAAYNPWNAQQQPPQHAQQQQPGYAQQAPF